MCGICGVMSLRPPGPDGPRITETAVSRMRDAMRHRGPDDEGVYVADGIGLGHRRLSIIDLAGGHQPMANPDESVWITYNGEVYNFQELRAELEARGFDFRTKSDTEVIVRGYEAWGDGVVERLRGMFAFALWDGRRRRLLLARDPLGIKPLYYTRLAADGVFLFGSEIRALLAWPRVRAQVDADALWDYLGHRYVPGPRTLFKSISKLPPGHLAVVAGDELTIRRYWDVPLDGGTWSEAECVRAFRDLVTDSVQRELVSDVPLGVFLSGGLDSTTVTGLMAGMTTEPVRTFCVGYRAEQGVNERPYARLAAEKFGTVHREVEIGLEEFWRLLPEAVASMEEPVAEAPSVSLLQLSRFTRRHVTVVLSGEGADENLAGYGIYRHTLGTRPLGWLGLAGPLAELAGRHRTARALERLRQGVDDYRGVSAIFTRGQRRRLLGRGAPAVDSAAVHYARSRGLSPLQRMLYFDQKVWLPDDLLVKADKMTMAASLELRVPFLDHKVVEWAWRVPPSLKIQGDRGKILLRRAFGDLVPTPILARDKEGFTVGGGSRFAHNVGREAQRLLLDEHAVDDLVDRAEVTRLVRRHTDGVENVMEQLMVLIVLAWWRRHFLV